jgi:hypothetical protein
LVRTSQRELGQPDDEIRRSLAQHGHDVPLKEIRRPSTSSGLHKKLAAAAEELRVDRDKAWPKFARWLWKRIKGMRLAIGTVLLPDLMPGMSLLPALMPVRIPLKQRVLTTLETLALDVEALGKATPCATTLREEGRERYSEVDVPSLH